MGCSSSRTMSRITIPKKTIIEKKITGNTFKKIKKLGEGGFGKVFLIKSQKTGREYVLKVIEKLENSILINREINNLRILDHPNIISIKVAFLSKDKNKVYIITDYAEGGDLEKEFKRHQESKSYFEEKILLYF